MSKTLTEAVQDITVIRQKETTDDEDRTDALKSFIDLRVYLMVISQLGKADGNVSKTG